MANKGNGSIRSDKKRRVKLINGSVLAHWRLIVTLLLFAHSVSSIVECQEQLTIDDRLQKDSLTISNELAETMRYLEKLERLDQYWSEVGRPRFGRSGYKQPAQGYRFAAAATNELKPQRPMAKYMYWPRQGGGRGENALFDLMSARLAQKYNSNEAY